MNYDKLEKWADLGILSLDTQVYDLTRVTPFIEEINQANVDANAPLFASGLPPASSFVVALSNEERGEIYMHVSRVSDNFVQCTVMEVLEVIELRRKTNEMRSKAYGNVLLYEKQLRSAPQDVLDMLGIDRNDSLADISTKYITNTDDGPKREDAKDEFALIEIGVPYPKEPTWQSAVLHYCSAACEFMAMPIVAKERGAMPRPARRRLESKGKSVSLVTVEVTRSVSQGYKRATPSDHGRALHFVSGHWRLSEASLHRKWVFDGWRIWIEGHWRGDPAYGVVLHRYVAKQRAVA